MHFIIFQIQVERQILHFFMMNSNHIVYQQTILQELELCA